MFFKDFVSVKRQKIKRGASQTYDTPSFSAIKRQEKVLHFNRHHVDGNKMNPTEKKEQSKDKSQMIEQYESYRQN